MKVTHPGAEQFVPDSTSLERLASAAAACGGCGLYRGATRTVFGAGPPDASVVIAGEQPGDREDLSGEPFVGPAGGLLNRALEEAGIDRELVYVTNAVKHFKFVPPERGKRRIHQKPSRMEVVACRPWLLAEIAAIEPELVICLGATAAQSLLGTCRSPFALCERGLRARSVNTLENDQRLVLVDDLEGTVHRAYGALPNYVDIIDPQGTVVFRSDWNKPNAVREALRGGQPARELRDQVSGLAPRHLIRVLRRAGRDTLFDFAVAIPKFVLTHGRNAVNRRVRANKNASRMVSPRGQSPMNPTDLATSNAGTR